MAGFPGFLTRLALGPIFRNRSKIRNAETALSAEQINLAFWQVAGMNGCVPRAWVKCTVSGGVVTVVEKWLAWDPNGTLPLNEVQMGYNSSGAYTWALANSSYVDQNGTLVPISIRFAEMVPGVPARWGVADVGVSGIAGNALSYNTGGIASESAVFLLKLY